MQSLCKMMIMGLSLKKPWFQCLNLVSHLLKPRTSSFFLSHLRTRVQWKLRHSTHFSTYFRRALHVKFQICNLIGLKICKGSKVLTCRLTTVQQRETRWPRFYIKFHVKGHKGSKLQSLHGIFIAL